MKYKTCPVCNIPYNVSRLRDESKVFICQDCEIRDKAKIRGKKARTIYNKLGLAKYVYKGATQ